MEGRYGARETETSSECTGACDAGFYCPAGSHRSTQVVCGAAIPSEAAPSLSFVGEAAEPLELFSSVSNAIDHRFFCPPGSATPRVAQEGHYTIADPATTKKRLRPFNASDADLDGFVSWREFTGSIAFRPFMATITPTQASPRGKTGDSSQLEAALGPEADSQEARKLWKMADEDLDGLLDEREFSLVKDALYTDGSQVEGFESVYSDRHPSLGVVQTRVSEKRCEAGYYCPGDGMRYECPRGHFGAEEGLTSPSCSGPCPAGMSTLPFPLSLWLSPLTIHALFLSSSLVLVHAARA